MVNAMKNLNMLNITSSKDYVCVDVISSYISRKCDIIFVIFIIFAIVSLSSFLPLKRIMMFYHFMSWRIRLESWKVMRSRKEAGGDWRHASVA